VISNLARKTHTRQKWSGEFAIDLDLNACAECPNSKGGMTMKKGNFVTLTAAMFACALLFGACEKKEDQTAPSSTSTSQAPTDKSSSDQSTAAPSSGSSTDSGSVQKPDDTSKAPKG
jgi:hypothetical protein